MHKRKTNMTYKVVVLPDIQAHEGENGNTHDVRSISAVLKYIADERWDELVIIGDFMDYPQVSRWKEDDLAAQVDTLKHDNDIGQALLDRIEKACRRKNKKCKITFILGNHDIRPELFAKKHPQLRGLIEIETDGGLGLARRGYNIVRSYPDGAVYRIGKAHFIHGRFTGVGHAKKHADVYGVNIFYGHVHDAMSFAKILWGKGKTIIAQSLGCLCIYSLDYVGGNPTNWQQAVTTFHFRRDGHFNHYVSRIFNHRFIAPSGKEYGP